MNALQRLSRSLLFLPVLLQSPCAAQSVRLLDPLAVRANVDPSRAVVAVNIPAVLHEKSCDVVIIGGGLGGSAAALAAAEAGSTVCLTEPTHWLGGQMTSQGVSAFDDNQWTETSGSSRSFKLLRAKIREHYEPLLLPGRKSSEPLNPGACWVSYECAEAAVDHTALISMLQPYVSNATLAVFLRTAPVAVVKQKGVIRSVITYNFETHTFLRLSGAVFIDATELGEFLPMVGATYRTGAESQQQTGEPDAPTVANPADLQSFTYVFVLAGQQPVSRSEPRPAGYRKYRSHYSLWSMDVDGKSYHYGFYSTLPTTPGSFWTYRRLVAQAQFQPGAFASDLSMINWDSNDVCDNRLLSDDPLEVAQALTHAKEVALGFAWWVRHQAPHDDGKGKGYPTLLLNAEALGSADGLSQFAYIRESRRLLAAKVVTEQDLVTKSARARRFEDAVGIGHYPIDIHSCSAPPHLPESKPYQIPFGALVSPSVDNLLAASKNIGTTHITNGAYRVHPTEWAIGTAAGLAAVAMSRTHSSALEIYSNPIRMRELQWSLIRSGQPVVWFSDVDTTSPYFRSAQLAALLGFVELKPDSLSFSPEAPVTGVEAAASLRSLAVLTGESSVVNLDRLSSLPSLQWLDLRTDAGSAAEESASPVTRGKFVEWVVQLYLDHNLLRD